MTCEKNIELDLKYIQVHKLAEIGAEIMNSCLVNSPIEGILNSDFSW